MALCVTAINGCVCVCNYHTHGKGNTMHSSVDVRQMILLPSSRSATTQTPSTGDTGLQQHASTVSVSTCSAYQHLPQDHSNHCN